MRTLNRIDTAFDEQMLLGNEPGATLLSRSEFELDAQQELISRNGGIPGLAGPPVLAAEMIGHTVLITSKAGRLAPWKGLRGCAVDVARDGRIVVDVAIGTVCCDPSALELVP
jgi:hypothetical protein